METNFHTYSIWYIHASHCHHVIAIRISQVREHHQPSPFIFYPNSLWSPDPWANIKPHWLLVETACPVRTRQDLHLSINQTTLTSFQLFVNCNCLYPYCWKNKIIITQLALTRQELVHLSIRSGQEICFTNRQILLEFRLLLFKLSLDLPGATNVSDKCTFTFSLVVWLETPCCIQ